MTTKSFIRVQTYIFYWWLLDLYILKQYHKMNTNCWKLIDYLFFSIFQESLTPLAGWCPHLGNIRSPQEVLKEEAWLPPL